MIVSFITRKNTKENSVSIFLFQWVSSSVFSQISHIGSLNFHTFLRDYLNIYKGVIIFLVAECYPSDAKSQKKSDNKLKKKLDVVLKKPEAKECDQTCREFAGCIGYTLFEGAHDSNPKDNKLDCNFFVQNQVKVSDPRKGLKECVKIAKRIGKFDVNIDI